MKDEGTEGTWWLVLVHQFPQKPGSLRVKVWRRLQSLGAVAIKNSMYALPGNEQTREDFAWLLEEIIAGGAEGAILEARFLDGLDDEQIRALFNQARDEDYAALCEEVRGVLDGLPLQGTPGEAEIQAAGQQLSRVERRLNEIEAIDFFGAPRRGAAQGLVAKLAGRIAAAREPRAEGGMKMEEVRTKELTRRIWVTRRGVRVDRIASAWLVRRWIDPEATFKFTSDKSYEPGEREVRFDMFEAEFTHEGDRCTFEVLLERAGLSDPALRRIGEIVHDIDLKDGRYGHQETAGIASLLDGITASSEEDDQRLERGGTVFDGLYHSFRAARTPPRRGRGGS